LEGIYEFQAGLKSKMGSILGMVWQPVVLMWELSANTMDGKGLGLWHGGSFFMQLASSSH